MDREWREAIDMRSSLVNVGLVVVSAALLRYWSLRLGFVSAIETEVVRGASQLIRTGSYRPAALTHPTLPLYLHTAVAIVHFLVGAVRGAWTSLADYGPHQFVAWGRGFSAFLGTAVVVIVYQIGMRWGARHALLAAGLMAVTPAHVAVSREIGDGSPLVFFSALTLLCSLAAVERGRRRSFIAAGAAAGLAASSHYAGAVILIVPLIAGWMTVNDERSRLSRAAWVVTAAVAAFVVTTPLSVRDLPAFLDGFAAAASPWTAGSTAGAAGALELMRQLMRAFDWPGMMLVLAGVALAIIRAITGPGHSRWTLLVSFPVLYFTVAAWHGFTADTVLLPLLPAAVVLAANAVISGVSLLRRFDIPRAARTTLIAALTVIAVLPPAVHSIALVHRAGR
jgi:4-amino-4-deoxy-L-arabinose transferase-like glycosyltransferase